MKEAERIMRRAYSFWGKAYLILENKSRDMKKGKKFLENKSREMEKGKNILENTHRDMENK